MNSSLSTSIGSLTLERPTILASGILGISLDVFKRLYDAGAGAVVTCDVSDNEVVVGVPARFLRYFSPEVDLSSFD